MSVSEEDWFVSAFRDEYVVVYPHRDLASARAEVAWLTERGVAGRVLDLCCGFGRHTLAFLERGLDAFGMDLSQDLLRRGLAQPEGARLSGRIVRADARRLPYHGASFDAVVNLFSSFGYFGDDGDRAMLDEIARVLATGGLLVMDTMNPEHVRANLVPSSTSTRAGLVLREERRLSEGGHRVHKTVTLSHADGSARTWREDVRMYAPDELERLLVERGLVVTQRDGGYSGEPAGPLAPRQIVRARRNRYDRTRPL